MTDEEKEDKDKKETEVKKLIKVVNMDLATAEKSDKRCPKCTDFLIVGSDWQYCLTCGWYHVDEE